MAQTNSVPDSTSSTVPLLGVGYDTSNSQLVVQGSAWLIGAFIVAAIAILGLKFRRWSRHKILEIDEAEIGIGPGKIKLRPNFTDRQVAYQIWVELSTRKIGLEIDLAHDVISEVYDSWHKFFGVTRDLIKSIPVSRVSDASTKQIINLSIEVLNEGLRPHLTQWHARFRRWYDQQQPPAGTLADEPQKIQGQFPQFQVLEKDLLAVNRRLMAYRRAMYALVYGAK